MELDEPVFEQYLGEQLRLTYPAGQPAAEAPELPSPTPVEAPGAETNALIQT